MMPVAFLLSLQAAGMVVDWLNTSDQAKLAKSGNDLEQADITAQIQSSRVQASDASVESMKNLRQTLGSQLAMQAARGVRQGTSTALLPANESLGNFNADQRIRQLNEMGSENSLKAKSLLSNLDSKTTNNQQWNQFRQRAINKIPTSPTAYGFGMTKVGGG